MSLEQLIKDINKKFKATIISEGVHNTTIPRIPFSSPRLNYMTYGGVPTKRITEFSGAENSGKTTSALDIVKNAQKMYPDRNIVYVDCEHTLDEDWAKLLGVDVDTLILLKPEEQSAEQIFEMITNIVETGEVALIVLDSIGVMVSAQALGKTLEEKTMAGISGALTSFSNQLIPLLVKYNCTFIGINQMRDDMNSAYGAEKTTGGHAWRHVCSMRIQFRKSDFIDEEGKSLTRNVENPAGNLVACHLIKSKVCRSDRKINYFTLNYLEGIDYVMDTIDVAMKYQFIVQAGAWYRFMNVETGEILQYDGKPLQFQGKAKLKQFLKDNDDVFEELTEKIEENIMIPVKII